MFCTLFHNLPGSAQSTVPLVITLYIVLTAHACIIYQSCCDTMSRDGLVVVGFVLVAEVAVTAHGLLNSSPAVLLNVIGIAVIQFLASVAYFLYTEGNLARDAGGRWLDLGGVAVREGNWRHMVAQGGSMDEDERDMERRITDERF